MRFLKRSFQKWANSVKIACNLNMSKVYIQEVTQVLLQSRSNKSFKICHVVPPYGKTEDLSLLTYEQTEDKRLEDCYRISIIAHLHTKAVHFCFAKCGS